MFGFFLTLALKLGMAAKIKEYKNDLGELIGAEIWFKDGFYAAYGTIPLSIPDEELHENIEVNFEPNSPLSESS